jgi:peptidoglycan hydrolase CwlO-like protein
MWHRLADILYAWLCLSHTTLAFLDPNPAGSTTSGNHMDILLDQMTHRMTLMENLHATQITALQNTVSSLQTDMNNKDSQISSLQTNMNNKDSQIASQQQSISSLQTDMANKDLEIASIQNTLATQGKNITELYLIILLYYLA